jgi:hypothetical protein
VACVIDTSSREWMAQCEAREWLARIRAKKPRSVAEGTGLLNVLIDSIAKRRGQPAADALRKLIETERTKK